MQNKGSLMVLNEIEKTKIITVSEFLKD